MNGSLPPGEAPRRPGRAIRDPAFVAPAIAEARRSLVTGLQLRVE